MNTATVKTALNPRAKTFAFVSVVRGESGVERGKAKTFGLLLEKVSHQPFSTSAVFVSSLQKILTLGMRRPASSTASQHSGTHQPELVDWINDRRLQAVVDLTAMASRLFGPGVERKVSLRLDPERRPADYAVLTFTVDAPNSQALFARENQLIDWLIERYPDVEDDLVLICRRRIR